MKILFLCPCPQENKNFYAGIHQGLGILCAIARNAGHNVMASNFSDCDGVKKLLEFHPDTVFLSSFTSQMNRCREALQVFRDYGIPVIIGGVHATFAPDDFDFYDYQYLVRGEGELFTDNYLKDPQSVRVMPGVYSRGRKNPGFAPITELKGLPFTERYSDPPLKVRNLMGFEVLSSRGCPCSCTYCSSPALKKAYPGYFRRREVSDVISEIEKNGSSFSLIGFHDDYFLSDLNWLSEFCRQYDKKIKKPFWCNSRVESVTEDVILLLKKTGLIRMHMGVEAGEYETRKTLLRRDISDQQIISAFDLCRNHGIKTLSFNMLGLPGETEEKIEKLIMLNRRLKPDRIHYSIFQPYPGTELDKISRENKIFYPVMESYYQWSEVPELAGISKEKLKYYLDNFIKLIQRSDD